MAGVLVVQVSSSAQVSAKAMGTGEASVGGVGVSWKSGARLHEWASVGGAGSAGEAK